MTEEFPATDVRPYIDIINAYAKELVLQAAIVGPIMDEIEENARTGE